MSRVGDSDDAIQEYNEVQLREQMLRDKRTNEAKITKSFNEVMQQKAVQKQGETLNKKQEKQSNPQKGDPKKAQAGVLKSGKARDELGKRAAMSKAMLGSLGKARAGMASSALDAESARTDALRRNSDDDKETIDDDLDRKDRDDVRLTDERHELLRQDPNAPSSGALEERVDRDGRQRHGRQDQQEERTEGVAAAEGPRPAQMVKLPQEILEHIAKAVALAIAADGRAEVQVSLKGTMLDGVLLKVSSKAGKVRCSFEGCDRNTRNLIESSKGDLMRALAKKGFELEILRVK
jgi:hypothetical protein